MFLARAIRVLCLGLCLLGVILTGQAATQLRADEEILIYPAMGWPVKDGTAWKIEVQGCIYEPEQRTFALAVLRRGLRLKGITLTPAEEVVLAQRASFFMADHERGKRVVIRFCGEDFALGKTGPDGRFSRTLEIDAAKVESSTTNHLKLRAVLPAGDKRCFSGDVFLMRDRRLTVLSDIDDTVKISMVTNSRAMLRKTFLEPFQPVPGMVELYQKLAREQVAQFAYVSASPWQLLPALSEFVRDNGFPAGAFFLKEFRLQDRTALNLLQDPGKYKPAVMERVFERLPKAQFILIGDAGERDPEIFAKLAAKHPRQVRMILIRDVSGATRTSGRYLDLSLPDEVSLQVFSDPAELDVEVISKGVGSSPAK